MMLSGSAFAPRAIHLSAQPVDDDAMVPEPGQVVVLGKVAHLLAGSHQFAPFLAPGHSFAVFTACFQVPLLPDQRTDPSAPAQHQQDDARTRQGKSARALFCHQSGKMRNEKVATGETALPA